MWKIKTPEELLQQINRMDRENSVKQFEIPGKGRFTIVLQEETQNSIKSEVDSDQELSRLITESRIAYKEGKVQNTSDFIKSITPEDFK